MQRRGAGRHPPRPRDTEARAARRAPPRPPYLPTPNLNAPVAGYRGHLAGATVFFGLYLAALALAYSVDQAYRQFTDLELVAIPVALFGLCLMFGLWPDVDTNSKGQNLFYAIFFVVDVVLIATRHTEEAAYLGLFCILPALGKHRGWTHSTWAMLLIPSPLLALPRRARARRPARRAPVLRRRRRRLLQPPRHGRARRAPARAPPPGGVVAGARCPRVAPVRGRPSPSTREAEAGAGQCLAPRPTSPPRPVSSRSPPPLPSSNGLSLQVVGVAR